MKKIFFFILFVIVGFQINVVKAQVPGAPTNLVATGINTGGMIQFSAPASNGGSPITNYEYSTDNGATWITPSPAITTSPIIISSGLTNCTSYQVKIRAVNAAGSGTASAAAQLIPATSVDMGVNWTERTSAADNNWQSVAYGNGLFVAVAGSGIGNRVMTSPDGVTWTIRTSAADNNWQSVAYGNGLFVAVAVTNNGSVNRVMTSENGIIWTIRTFSGNPIYSVTYGNGLFVAVANNTQTTNVLTSPDGITWTYNNTTQRLSSSVITSVTYGNGLFVAVTNNGSGNRVRTSPDGITWTARTSAADNTWNSVTYGNGRFVAVASSGTSNRVMTSDDGITWTIRSSAADNDWRSVTYGNGLFVAVAISGTGNRVMTSPDGITWTARSSSADNNWTCVTYGNGLFVAVASSGTGNRVMTSGYNIVADAPVISSATFGNSTTVNFTQSASALSPSISNYEYSTDNGSNWVAVSPAATTSPLTITGLATIPSSIMIRAVNSVGSSCPSNNFLPPTPPTAAAQTFCGSKTIADLVATGTDLKWYDVATNGTALASTIAITSGTYYVTQTLNNNESARTSVSVTVNPTINNFTSDGINYVVTSPTTVSVGVNASATGVVIIPAAVTTACGTYAVTSISDYAFLQCSALTSVTIPNSVSSIGLAAFGLTGLTSVTIPNSVTNIEQYAFAYCSNLTSVTCNASVPITIDASVFEGVNQSGCILVVTAGTIATYEAAGVWQDFGLVVSNPTFTNTTTISACNSYTWLVNNQTYTTSGTYYYASTNDGTNYNVETLALTLQSNFTIDDINYVVTSPTTVEVGINSGATGVVAISAAVTTACGTYAVTGIGNVAFENCSGLTQVTIPDSVTSIGNSAFQNCSGLTSVTIPDSVTSIGNSAFQNCSGLTSVTIPNSVTSIGNSAFQNCSGLTQITIPDSVTSIGNSVFQNCSGLTSVTIPNSVMSIGQYAFEDCTGLTSVTLPNAITSISEGVFRSCSQLPSISIPNSVTSIGEYVFYGCSGLTSVSISNSLTNIGNYAFENCTGLTLVTIPNSVTSIGISAFFGCGGLTSITIPNSVTSIGNGAFQNCNNLTSVNISNSIMSIADSTFAGCTGLTSVTIPNSVTSIGDSAFNTCTGLTSITIENSVTSIGQRAFANCFSLTSVICNVSTPMTITANVFADVNQAACSLAVPAASVAAYQAAAVWQNFNPILYLQVTVGLNKYGQKTTNPSEFVNKNGAIGISGILATGESINSAPVISATAAVTNLTSTSAISGGTVSADGGASVTARGVCWSSTPNPTIANSKTTDGNGTGTFTSAITGLTSGTTYYVQSYATNSVGTTYGPEVIFTTL